MSTRVYIGRLARDARERDIERLLKGYGRIREINLKNGYGFVEFKDPRDAEDVVYDFHGKEFLGERLIVELARGGRRGREDRRRNDDRRSHYRLIVENIPSGTSWQDLKDMMRKAGEVTFADIIKSRPGEGVVEFAHRSDMEYALRKLNDTELNGQRVTLTEDTNRRSRRSRSRSVSRSRSPRRDSGRDRRRSRSRSPSGSRSPRGRSDRDRDRRRRDDDADMDDKRKDSPRSDRSRSRSPPRRSERRDGSDKDTNAADGSPRSDGRRGRSYSRSRSRSPARSLSPRRD